MLVGMRLPRTSCRKCISWPLPPTKHGPRERVILWKLISLRLMDWLLIKLWLTLIAPLKWYPLAHSSLFLLLLSFSMHISPLLSFRLIILHSILFLFVIYSIHYHMHIFCPSRYFFHFVFAPQNNLLILLFYIFSLLVILFIDAM